MQRKYPRWCDNSHIRSKAQEQWVGRCDHARALAASKRVPDKQPRCICLALRKGCALSGLVGIFRASSTTSTALSVSCTGFTASTNARPQCVLSHSSVKLWARNLGTASSLRTRTDESDVGIQHVQGIIRTTWYIKRTRIYLINTQMPKRNRTSYCGTALRINYAL